MPDFLKLEPAPGPERVIEDRDQMNLSRSWSQWFGKAFHFWNRLAPSVDYLANADATLYPGKSAVTQICITPLTVSRVLTLSNDKVWNGARFLCVRTSASTGNYTISVGGLKTLSSGEWCEVEFDGSAWVITRSGVIANSSSLTTPWYWRGADGTILVEIEADGTLVFHDSATVWDDIDIDITSAKPGASAPSFLPIYSSGSIKGNHFGTGDDIHADKEILHSYLQGSDITVHGHFSAIDGNLGDITFGLEYVWQNVDDPEHAPITLTATQAASGTAWDHQKFSFPVISGAGKRIGSHFTLRFFVQSKTYASRVYVKNIGIHYQKDTIGSRDVTAK